MSYESKKVNKTHAVLICGSYGHNNAGDEAILEAILENFSTAEKRTSFTVMSRNPSETQQRHGVPAIYKFNFFSMIREMLRAELYINGGGSLIQDITSSRSLYYYLFTIVLAKLMRCRVIMYGCGIGPVGRVRNRKIASFIINHFVDSITLREYDSLSELESFGVKKPKMQVTSDPALNLSPSPEVEVTEQMQRLGISPDGKYLCIVPRMWSGFETRAKHFAACADYISEKYGLTTVFVSIDHKNDSLAAEMIAKDMQSEYVIVYDVLPSRLTIGLLSRMCAVISMRLHGLVFSASCGVPLVGVSYDPKVSAFFHQLGQEQCVELDELSSEALINMTQSALSLWDNGEVLKKRVENLRAVESGNLRAALELLAD